MSSKSLQFNKTGATESLRLVAESFQFSNMSSNSNGGGSFVYLKESHTSVIGMREYVKRDVPCYALPSDEIGEYFNVESHSGMLNNVDTNTSNVSSVSQEKQGKVTKEVTVLC